MAEQMFNSDQLEYMSYLASLPPEEKCKCGWYRRGECYNDTRENGGNGYREQVEARRSSNEGSAK